MNYEWNLPDQGLLTFVASTRRIKEVLLSYDGPALVALTDDHDQFLGIAVDEDESGETVRWIQALISDLELDAIKIGAEPLRWAFRKERVTIADYSRRYNQPLRVWDIPLGLVPNEALPQPEAFFPGSRKRRLQFPTERPTFHLAGRTSPDRVTFGELSAVASALQSLWGAFAQSLHVNLAPLAVTAFEPGSLKVMVHTDNPLAFHRIGEEYRKLVLASEDREKLEAAIAPLDPRVASTYRDYLQTLKLHQVEVLAEWREEAAFVNDNCLSNVLVGYALLWEVRHAPTGEPGCTRAATTPRDRLAPA